MTYPLHPTAPHFPQATPKGDLGTNWSSHARGPAPMQVTPPGMVGAPAQPPMPGPVNMPAQPQMQAPPPPQPPLQSDQTPPPMDAAQAASAASAPSSGAPGQQPSFFQFLSDAARRMSENAAERRRARQDGRERQQHGLGQGPLGKMMGGPQGLFQGAPAQPPTPGPRPSSGPGLAPSMPGLRGLFGG